MRKILRAVSEKTALPTNQPIITNNTDFIGPTWLTPVQQEIKQQKDDKVNEERFDKAYG